MALKEYRRKRNFNGTPEPAGRRARDKQRALRYVIQKHAARQLHFDFRLEWRGALKSWAVPKGPSLDPADKRLAVEVEDHPVEYGKFEGTIPKGHYGAGKVELWDEGTWEPLEGVDEGLKEGHLKFRLNGAKLEGVWALVRMALRDGDTRNNWLLVKDRDEFARRNGKVVAGRRSGAPRTAGNSRTPRTSAARASAGALRPTPIEPELATLAKTPPAGTGWVYEIKFDGYRILAHVRAGAVTLMSRNHKDWTERFEPVAAELARLGRHEAVIDGEVVALKADGTSDFQTLQNRLERGKTDALVYFAFDLLRLDGTDLTGRPLLERKQALERLLKGLGKQELVRFTEHVEGAGAKVLAHACRLGLEGVIAKRADAPYRAGRGRDWLKLKCQENQEFVIAGWTDPAGSRTRLGALLLGVRGEEGELRYAGKVGTGFDDATLRDLSRRLSGLAVQRSPLSNPPAGAAGRAHWVRPKLVAQVEFTEWTRDGLLRHPSFQGLREDKDPSDVVRERKAGTVTIGGVRVTHPDRVVFPALGITKRELVDYYHAVAMRMLPHLVGRPLMILKCPGGEGKPCFFQKHAGDSIPRGVAPIQIPDEKGGPAATYLRMENAAGLLGLVQLGVIEFHVWGARAPQIERPDRVVFDLDPDPAVPWARVVAGAVLVRQELERRGLRSFVKTTGGKGLHVVAPVDPVLPWARVREWARQVAAVLASAHPKEFTAMLPRARRKGKIFLDYLRNGRGATWVAPYSVRAREGAGVSMPLSWSALERSDPAAFTVQTAAKAGGRDPWSGLDQVRQRLE